jgi:hypothetical protein
MLSRVCGVQLPSDVDKEYTTTDVNGNISQGLIPGVEMFRLSVKLLKIMHGVLETIYESDQSQLACTSGSRDVELLRKTLDLNHQLDEFLASLPIRLSSFITLAPLENPGRACDFNMHEQALLTRLVFRVSLSKTPHFSYKDSSCSQHTDSCMLGSCSYVH